MKYPLSVNQSATKFLLSAGSQVNMLKTNIQARSFFKFIHNPSYLRKQIDK